MVLILICMCLTVPSAVIAKEDFIAAVFEHRHRHDSSQPPTEIILSNLRFFEKAIEVAAQRGADIILFNEYGLFPYNDDRAVLRKFMEHVPDPTKVSFNPCTENANDRMILHTLSCLARQHKMYIAANMGDVQPCDATCEAHGIDSCTENCPYDGVFMYNTDVAFDREGNLIARYHKYNLYFEKLNIPQKREFVTFKTDFGTFGFIVCFDSVFEGSANFVKTHGVDTLLFVTYWFDDIVPLNAIEFQSSWALANGVNVLAANAHSPKTSSFGSGIYTKDGEALVYTYDPDGESKLLMAKIHRTSGDSETGSITVITDNDVFPKDETGQNLPEHCYDEEGIAKFLKSESLIHKCFNWKTENYTLVKLQTSSGSIKSCNNGFCCSLKYSADDMKENFYLAARNGTNNVRNYYHWWEETCLLIRCDQHNDKTCVKQASSSKTIFRSLKMAATFTAERIYPAVTKHKFRLAPKNEWNTYKKGSETVLKFKSESDEPLLRVGLLGRCYYRDPPYVPFHKF